MLPADGSGYDADLYTLSKPQFGYIGLQIKGRKLTDEPTDRQNRIPYAQISLTLLLAPPRHILRQYEEYTQCHDNNDPIRDVTRLSCWHLSLLRADIAPRTCHYTGTQQAPQQSASLSLPAAGLQLRGKCHTTDLTYLPRL